MKTFTEVVNDYIDIRNVHKKEKMKTFKESVQELIAFKEDKPKGKEKLIVGSEKQPGADVKSKVIANGDKPTKTNPEKKKKKSNTEIKKKASCKTKKSLKEQMVELCDTSTIMNEVSWEDIKYKAGQFGKKAGETAKSAGRKVADAAGYAKAGYSKYAGDVIDRVSGRNKEAKKETESDTGNKTLNKLGNFILGKSGLKEKFPVRDVIWALRKIGVKADNSTFDNNKNDTYMPIGYFLTALRAEDITFDKEALLKALKAKSKPLLSKDTDEEKETEDEFEDETEEKEDKKKKKDDEEDDLEESFKYFKY